MTLTVWLLFFMTSVYPNPGVTMYFTEGECLKARSVLMAETFRLTYVTQCQRTTVVMTKPQR